MEYDVSKEKEEGISLSDIFRALRLNWLIIAFVTLVATLAVAGYVVFMMPNRYRSSVEMTFLIYASGGTDENPQYDFVNTQRFMETAASTIRSDYAINTLRARATVDIPEGYRNSDIANDLTIRSSSSSFIVVISYTHEDPEFAYEMANEISEVAIYVLSEDYHGLFRKLGDASEPVIDSPSKIFLVVVGFIGGLVAGAGFVFIKHLLKNSYFTKEELEAGTGVQVLGVIPQFHMKEGKRK